MVTVAVKSNASLPETVKFQATARLSIVPSPVRGHGERFIGAHARLGPEICDMDGRGAQPTDTLSISGIPSPSSSGNEGVRLTAPPSKSAHRVPSLGEAV